MHESSHEITALLLAWSAGEPGARDRLVPIVYRELRRRAAAQLRRERRGDTLQPTALVHEAYLRLVDQREAVWHNRAQFFAMAAEIMRRILGPLGALPPSTERPRTSRNARWRRLLAPLRLTQLIGIHPHRIPPGELVIRNRRPVIRLRPQTREGLSHGCW